MKDFFKVSEVQKITGLTRKQLWYWHKSQFIRSSYVTAKGGDKLYTFQNIVMLSYAKLLRENGKSVQQMRRTMYDLKTSFSKLESSILDSSILSKDNCIMIFSGDIISSDNLEGYVTLNINNVLKKITDLYGECNTSGIICGQKANYFIPKPQNPLLSIAQNNTKTYYHNTGKDISLYFDNFNK